jgi:hypothetical protein
LDRAPLRSVQTKGCSELIHGYRSILTPGRGVCKNCDGNYIVVSLFCYGLTVGLRTYLVIWNRQ